jgi:preprotein translocase subunit Sec63
MLILIIPIVTGGVFIKKHYSKNKCRSCGGIISSKSKSLCVQCVQKKKIKKESAEKRNYNQYSNYKIYDRYSKTEDNKLFEKPKRKFEGRTYYEILGLDNNSTPDQIKTRFRELCLKFHPDKEKSSLANEFMQEIKEAYETLSDPKKREHYDRTTIK